MIFFSQICEFKKSENKLTWENKTYKIEYNIKNLDTNVFKKSKKGEKLIHNKLKFDSYSLYKTNKFEKYDMVLVHGGLYRNVIGHFDTISGKTNARIIIGDDFICPSFKKCYNTKKITFELFNQYI